MAEEEIQEEVAEESSTETELEAPPEAEGQGTETTDAAESESPDVWGNFRSMEQFQGQDDAAIAQTLQSAMEQQQAAQHALQQYQSIVPVAQEYLNNREAFESWKAAQNNPAPQQAPVQQAPEPEEPWFNPPKISDADKRYLTRDETGREVIAEGAPLDVQGRLREYQTYRADFAEKLINNPQEALGPMIEKMAQQQANNIVETRVSEMQDQQYVSQLEAENKDWLYDQQGNVSAEGLAVQKYIQDAKSLGIAGAQARWDFATKMVERDLLLNNMNQQQAAQQQQAAAAPQATPQTAPQPTQAEQNMEYLRNQAKRSASQRSVASSDARAPQATMTFEERLLAQAQEQGLL